MTLSAPMAAALTQPAVLMSYCLELKLPGHDLRLTDGGFYSFPVDGVVQAFHAKDDVFGVLGAVGEITDGVVDQFPTVDVVILPASNAAVAALSAPEAQGSQARIWVLVLDRDTGQVLGTPERWFKGTTDVPSLTVGENGKALSISLNSVLAAARQADEGARLNDGFHQRAWPGERGLEFASGVGQVDYWGSTPPRPPVDYTAQRLSMLRALGVKL